jgi:hypothetical protein
MGSFRWTSCSLKERLVTKDVEMSDFFMMAWGCLCGFALSVFLCCMCLVYIHVLSVVP